MALGSLLDDNIFHEIMISRERRDVVLSVDRVRIRDRIKGDFHKLNLDRDLYIGGVPHVEDGMYYILLHLVVPKYLVSNISKSKPFSSMFSWTHLGLKYYPRLRT